MKSRQTDALKVVSFVGVAETEKVVASAVGRNPRGQLVDRRLFRTF